MRTLSALVVSVALVALASAAPSQAKYSDNFDCVWRTGPPYTWTYAPGKTVTKRSYNITGFKVTCSYAKKWIAILAKQPYKGANKTLKGGPPGWKCQSKQLPAVFHPKTAWIGVCQNRKHTEIVFDWTDQ